MSRRRRARSASTTCSDGSAFELSVASSTSSATRSESSPTSSCRASTTSVRCASGSPFARPSSSMFVRRLVSGVRISWLASVMSRCCCDREVARASTIVVKLRARLATSPSPSVGIGVVRSCVLAICSAVSRSFTTGRTIRRASHHPRAAAATVPPSASNESRRRMSASTACVSSRSRPIWMRPPSCHDEVSIR